MISDQNVPFTDGARGAYALNQQLIDAVSFRNVEDAFAWIRENRARVISKEGTPEKPVELSLSYIVNILDVAGKLERIDVQTLQRKCAAYDNYLANKQLVDAVSFRNVEDAFAWIRENRARVISKEGTPEKPIELSLGYIAAILDVAGKLERIDVQKLTWKCGAYDNYLANKQLVDAVSFRNVEDAFAWIRENRAKVISKEGTPEKPVELSLSYIAAILDVAGKLEGIDVQTLQRKCAAYDNYLANKQLVDAVSFRNVEDAFAWIRENRAKVISKEGTPEKPVELSLSYIAAILDVAGKLERIDVQKLTWKCGAYDNYLANKQLVDAVSFRNVEDAFAWIRENRAKVISKEGTPEKPIELSLGYIAAILDVAGKLERIDVQKLTWKCGAYDNYLANKQLVDAVSFRNVEDAFAWIRENRAKVISKEGTPEKPVELSLSYIAAILDVAGKLERIDVQKLTWKCGAYDNYLANKQLVDAVSFRNVEDAFAWIRENRAKVISKEGTPEKPIELSLGYIAAIIDVAGKLERIDVQTLQRKCAAYDNYLANKQLVDAVSFRNVEDAFAWIKS